MFHSALKAAQSRLRRVPAIHRAIRSVWSPPERVFQHLYFDGVFTVEVEPGAAFLMESHGELIENDLFWRGYGNGFEAQSLRRWRDLCRTSDFVCDVGANSGVYALSAKALNRHTKVIAVEPSIRVAEKLRRNITLNRFDIELVECAASDRSGTATFYETPDAHQYSASLEIEKGSGTIPTEVKVRTLDEILANLPRVDLVKMDIELHEPAALRGMRRTLERFRPTLLVEVLTEKAGKGVAAALDGLGYEAEPMHGEHNVLFATRR